MKARQFSLLLHSHIPYVQAHGSRPHAMAWLFSEVVIHDGRII